MCSVVLCQKGDGEERGWEYKRGPTAVHLATPREGGDLEIRVWEWRGREQLQERMEWSVVGFMMTILLEEKNLQGGKETKSG